jgi:hypothetical protein
VEVTTALIYDYVASFKVFDNLGNNVYEQISYTCQLNPDQIKTDYQPFARITKSHSDFEIRYIDPEPKNPGTEMLVNLELDLASGNQLKYAFKILRI